MRAASLARRATRIVPALALLCVSAAAQAGLFDDEQARANIEQLKKSLAEMQTQLDTVSRNQLDFANQVDALRAELAKLRGQVEVIGFDLDGAQKRQQDFYVDLDNRLRKLETPAPEAAPASNAAATTIPDTDSYERAVTALKAGNFKEAAAALDAFIDAYPQSQLLGSAHYWGGYAHSQLKAYRRAAALFGSFAERWMNDPRAPDALESQAASLAAAKDSAAAQAVLKHLAAMYPASEAGKRAKAQLKRK